MNAFRTLVSRKPLESTNSIHLFFGVEVKTFVIHDVMAVGLKFPGSVKAASFGSVGLHLLRDSKAWA